MRACTRILAAGICLCLRAAGAQPVEYPLHTGDRWQYTVEPMTAGIDHDSLMSNGQRYALIHYGFGWRDRWERAAGNQVFWYDTQAGQEYLWFDFSLSPGDTVSIISQTGDPIVITLADTGSHELFAVHRRWWSFWTDRVPGTMDDEDSTYVTDSLGVTRVSSMWYTTSLMGAIVQGTQYGTITHVGEPDGVPAGGFRLAQNFPNPFNPATRITFESTVAGPIRLSLFDLLGREVTLLTEGVMPAGLHRVRFDGSRLASGVYCYRLATPLGSSMKKLTILK